MFPVPCRHSAFPVYVRKKRGKEIRMGEKAPQRYGRRRRRRRRTAEEGQKYAEIKKGESEAPPPSLSSSTLETAMGNCYCFFSPTNGRFSFLFLLPASNFAVGNIRGRGGCGCGAFSSLLRLRLLRFIRLTSVEEKVVVWGGLGRAGPNVFKKG